MINVTNTQFLTALFGEEAGLCHVTDFPYDPGGIPSDKHLMSWMGDYFSRYQMGENTNQYFTISLFYCDDDKKARRRKALFRKTPVIVLDDVKEKLSMVEVSKLPKPSWILETSIGSEQWGYILDTPCEDRGQVENLLDGLVANGLAPQGKDPGMKGVTRYVRLPEGINNKASKLVNGLPHKCRMLAWEPFNTSTMESLAAPFHVDLNAPRRESRVDGAADISDHPLVNIPDVLVIKEIRSDGRFDVICPWVEEHTGADDSGAAIFTNSDNSIGFKCHHGACQNRTGGDLVRYIDNVTPGFSVSLKNWQVMKELSQFSNILTPEPVSFMVPIVPVTVQDVPVMGNPVPVISQDMPDALQLLCDALGREHPGTAEQRARASAVLKHADSLPKIEQKHWHEVVADIMCWTKADTKEILVDLRKTWYGDKVNDADFYEDVVFVKELNQFYVWSTRIFLSAEGFQNSFSHENAEARKIALQEGRVRKVDKLDYAPSYSRIFTENGCVYGNTWSDESQSRGVDGNCSKWIDHFDKLGWGANRSHVEKWMAYTLLHPDKKINHILLLGSGEGCGKDFLLHPLIAAMGNNACTINGECLLSAHNDFLFSTKYLHINEAELGGGRDGKSVSNKLKPIAAAPPMRLRVNPKGVKAISVRNIVNATMTTNAPVSPIHLSGVSRRYYALWSDLNTRDANDCMTSDWQEYWDSAWAWMVDDGGWESVVYHLMNNVDISDFNPSAAPPMTDFLKEIAEDSKSPSQQTLEAFMNKGHGGFRCDLLTATDMSDTLRAGVLYPADMAVKPEIFTARMVAKLLKELQRYSMVITLNHKIWVLRNPEKYSSMSIRQLEAEYLAQLQEAKCNVQLNVVN